MRSSSKKSVSQAFLYTKCMAYTPFRVCVASHSEKATNTRSRTPAHPRPETWFALPRYQRPSGEDAIAAGGDQQDA